MDLSPLKGFVTKISDLELHVIKRDQLRVETVSLGSDSRN